MKMDTEAARPRAPKRRRGWTGRAVVALVATLTVAVPVAWATHTFPDVPTESPHHDDVTAIKNAGITSGCNPPANTLYCPDQAVRRDQMASFLRRGFGRTTRGLGPNDTFVGDGAGLGSVVDVGSVTIAVPGVSGTQFVNVHGEAALFTNSTKATACTGGICNIYLYLFDGGTQLARSFVRISADFGGGEIGVSAVQAVTAGTSKTYTLRAQPFNVNSGLGIVHQPRIIASTFPFGGSGGATITEAPATTSVIDTSVGKSR